MNEIPITTITSRQGKFDENTLFCLGVCVDHNLPICVAFNPSRVSYSIVTGNAVDSMVELLKQQTIPEVRQEYGFHPIPNKSRVDFLRFEPKIFDELITNVAAPGLIHRIFYLNGISRNNVIAEEIRTYGIQIASLQGDVAEVGIRVALK